MRIREFIIEASYDGMIINLIKNYPTQREEIDKHVKWAKIILVKDDRVVWYLKLVQAQLKNELEPLLGKYQWTGFEKLQNKLSHYMGLQINGIQTYTFKTQTVDTVLSDLNELEKKYLKTSDAPVITQEGDYKLIKFDDGSAWWYINRSYCPDEGRSGKHCGNVVGKITKDQRILSYRINNKVIMTFILHGNGYLGEMKAKSNLKPNEKYHEIILKLLLHPIVKGISGGGYMPMQNFSICDMNENYIRILEKQKPKLIVDQITATPTDLLKAPLFLRKIPKLQQIFYNAYPQLSEWLTPNGEITVKDINIQIEIMDDSILNDMLEYLHNKWESHIDNYVYSKEDYEDYMKNTWIDAEDLKGIYSEFIDPDETFLDLPKIYERILKSVNKDITDYVIGGTFSNMKIVFKNRKWQVQYY